jgi:tetratricopeptide (TPR) repeat protein
VDSVLAAASQALSRGDPLAALRCVALRNDPAALALRGVSMAQLGEFAAARKLLSRAGRAFRGRDAGAQARCLAAEAEVALECRDLGAARTGFERAIPLLESAGDHGNAWFCRLQLARRLVLLGRLRDAGVALSQLRRRGLPPPRHALAELLAADVAVRRARPDDARVALDRALAAARASGIPALMADVRRALDDLEAPVGRLFERGAERLVTLRDVARVTASPDVLVDTCRREIRQGATTVSLFRRPVLLAIAATLGESWPGAAARETLIRRAFGRLRPTESVRVRLRVEVGRLRRALAPISEVNATTGGFVLAPRAGRAVRVLHPPTDGNAGLLLALLSGGEPWSTKSLAEALGTSTRTVQRTLLDLETNGKVRGIGSGRARRWAAAGLPGFATSLLLVAHASRGVEE